MGNSASTLTVQEWEQLHRESGLSKNSIKTLHGRFMELAKQKDEHGKEYMSREDFEAIPDLLKNPLGTRLIDVFFVDANASDQMRVYFRDFVKVLSHFRPLNKHSPHPWNSRESKLRFAFTMYDLNRSGTITKDEFTEILIRMIGGNVSREKVGRGQKSTAKRVPPKESQPKESRQKSPGTKESQAKRVPPKESQAKRVPPKESPAKKGQKSTMLQNNALSD